MLYGGIGIALAVGIRRGVCLLVVWWLSWVSGQ